MNSHNEDNQNIQISVSEIKQLFTTQNIKKINAVNHRLKWVKTYLKYIFEVT